MHLLMHSFTNFNKKMARIHQKISKTLIGHISESFRWISKIQNFVGRSGAWLSDQGAGQVEIGKIVKKGAVLCHICNDPIYGSHPQGVHPITHPHSSIKPPNHLLSHPLIHPYNYLDLALTRPSIQPVTIPTSH